MKTSNFILLMAIPVALMVVLSSVRLNPKHPDQMIYGAALVLFMAACAVFVWCFAERKKK